MLANETTVLKQFVNGYPDKTDIACWWCCHTFDTHPIGFPINFRCKAFYCVGCFCSFSCAVAWHKENQAVASNCSIERMRAQVFNSRDRNMVRAAPPRHMLKMFGGSMDIEQFRNGADERYITSFYPLISWSMYTDIISGSNRSAGKTVLKIRAATD